jgi:23S rRNA (guanosine2251-2'-O)-methyltransferase
MNKKIYKKNDTPNNHYYVYGKHSAIEALKNTQRKIISIYCTNIIFSEYQNLIKNFPYKISTNHEIDELLQMQANHQGLIVKTEMLTQDKLDITYLTKEQSVILILDQITDPQNIGAIIRNGAAFGADAVITSKTNSVLENSVISKISAGAIEKIQLISVVNISNYISILKKHGYWVVGLDGDAKESINHNYLKGKIAFVLGSEGSGIRKLVKENVDILYKIPISNVESLNVASTSAIALYSYYISNK